MFKVKVMRFFNKNKLLFLFLSSILVIRIYPFYIVPIQNALFSSHTLAKIIISCVILVLITSNFRRITKFISENKLLFVLISAFLVGQTLSIIFAADMSLFLKSYHNLIISIFIFLIGFLLIKMNPKSITVVNSFVVFLGVLTIFMDLFVQLFFNTFSGFFNLFIQNEVASALMFNASQGKYSLAIGTEMLLPFLLLTLFSVKNTKYKVFFASLILLMLFLTLLSNFRSRLLVFLFCTFCYFVISEIHKFSTISIVKQKIIKYSLTLALIIISTYSALFISNSLYSFNIVDRVLLSDRYADQGTLDTRLTQIANSTKMFESSPIFGVGLGNYANYINLNSRISAAQKPFVKTFLNTTLSHPHNIIFQLLSETGLIGLIPFVMLLIFFIVRDITFYKDQKYSHSINAYIISSWSLIAYSFFNPADSVFIIGWFWFCRGIVAGSIGAKKN